MRYVYWLRSRTGRLLIILLAIATYFFLLPVDALRYFPHSSANTTPHWLLWLRYGFSAFVALMFLGLVDVIRNAWYFYLYPPVSNWLDVINSVYYLLALTGSMITIIFSYRRSSSLRERQQQRIFVGGVILAVAPLLLLTVLPRALSLPSQYI